MWKIWPEHKRSRRIIIIAVIILVGLAGLAAVFSRPISRLASTSQSLGGTGLVAPMMAELAMADEDFAATKSRGANIAPLPPPEPSAGETAAEAEQRIIKNGSLNLVVDDVSAAAADISGLATAHDGYVQSTSISERTDGTHSGYVTVRVPVTVFETVMDEIKTLANVVKNESATGQDVTERYTDLEARLRNAKAQEETYLKVLDKAWTVEDILKVQERLGAIRSQIESLEGQIQYLENVTAFSTITCQLSEEPLVRVPTKEFRPWTAIQEAGRALVAVFQKLIIGLIWVIVVGGGIVLPILVLVVLVKLVKRLVRRRR